MPLILARMTCWAPWQRLPLRYQLSVRDSDNPHDMHGSIQDSKSSSVRSPRVSMPSHENINLALTPSTGNQVVSQIASAGIPQSPRDTTVKKPVEHGSRADDKGRPALTMKESGTLCRGRATMYFTVKTSPRENALGASHSQPSFPSRGSPFLETFKQQQRMILARRNFVDPSTTPPPSPRRTPRSQTSMNGAQFPVTKIDGQIKSGSKSAGTSKKAKGSITKPNLRDDDNTKQASIDCDVKTNRPKSSGLAINTLLPARDAKPYLKNPLYPESKSLRHVFKPNQTDSVIINDDGVVLIRSNRHATKSAPPNRTNSASYLAHLRRLYLRDPKDFVKITSPRKSDFTKKSLLHERLEYDKRTDSILNYYSRVDDVELATAWASAVEFSRRPDTSQSSKESPRSRNVARLSYRSPPRPNSARTRPNSARFPLERAATAPSGAVGGCKTSRDALDDWNEFLKINSRKAFHERQFYLRTPALGSHPYEGESLTINTSMADLENNVGSKDCHDENKEQVGDREGNQHDQSFLSTLKEGSHADQSERDECFEDPDRLNTTKELAKGVREDKTMSQKYDEEYFALDSELDLKTPKDEKLEIDRRNVIVGTADSNPVTQDLVSEAANGNGVVHIPYTSPQVTQLNKNDADQSKTCRIRNTHLINCRADESITNENNEDLTHSKQSETQVESALVMDSINSSGSNAELANKTKTQLENDTEDLRTVRAKNDIEAHKDLSNPITDPCHTVTALIRDTIERSEKNIEAINNSELQTISATTHAKKVVLDIQTGEVFVG